MKRSFWVAAGVIAIAVIAAIYYYRRDVQAEAPAFTTAEITRGNVISTVEATGTLEAVTTVQVGSQVSGTISALHADFNSEVRKGQIIAELDASLLETQVEQAKATVIRLQADADRARLQAADAALKLKRARELFERQLIPATDLETAESTARGADAAVKGAEAQVVQAQASLNQAQVNLSHTIIRAPIDGVVIARNVDVGQTVASSLQAPTLYILARDLTEMRVNASIDESDIGDIHPKQKVRFRVDAYPNETFTGRVAQVRLQPVVQQNVVSYVTVIDVPNPGLKLKPGMTAAVTIETARAEDVLKVPNAALRFTPADAGGTRPARAGNSRPPASSDDDKGAIWVLAQDRPTRVPVRTGISDGRDTAVLEGELTQGAAVITGTASTAAPAAATSPSTSPLLPFGNRGSGGRRGGSR
ncbi:MAG TPA: efflux RND transporter periplasmic adaptor subunit [Vicinamibacterales bacterium]|nr:efflux RND transporter periplasmic adaptor subunit [Vicinamibacterales bacterium]